MKKLSKVFLSVFLVFSLLSIINTQEVMEAKADEVTAEGSWGSVDWKIIDGDLKLSTGSFEPMSHETTANWYPYREDIKSITFEGEVIAKNNQWLFKDLINLTTINNIENFKPSGNMTRTFSDCLSLRSIDLSAMDSSNITSFDGMFSNCVSLEYINATNLVSANATDLHWMFRTCYNLGTIDGLDTWDVSNVFTMASMFEYNYALPSLDGAENWNTSSLVHTDWMFNGSSGYTDLSAISNWNTSNLKSMIFMFSSCISLEELDLSGWDTTNVFEDEMAEAFTGLTNLKKLSLGADFSFKLGRNPALLEIVSNPLYTGKWKTLSDGIIIDTSNDLMSYHNTNGVSETYVWQTVPYTITYKDGDELIGNIEYIDEGINTIESLESLEYSKPGFIFHGWNTNEDGSGTPYESGSIVSEAMTLYAQWEERVPVIEIDKDTYEINEAVKISGVGFEPDSKVTATLHSTPIEVGEFTLDNTGSFVGGFTIPSNIEVGTHTLKVSDGIHTAEVTLTITAPIIATPSLPSVKPDKTAPATGDSTDINMYVALMSVALLGISSILFKLKNEI